MFRDESRKVVGKARKATQPPSASNGVPAGSSRELPCGIDADELNGTHDNTLLEVIETPGAARLSDSYFPQMVSLQPTLEDIATGFFFQNYVIDVRGPTRGHLDHLPNIYNTYDMDENLLASIKAVGFASYAHVALAPQLLKEARLQYTKALHLTNTALTFATEAKKDSTLLAIMVLGIFETVTGCNQKSLKDWAKHISGSSALVGLRGMEQMRTPHGRRMFIQVCSNLLISCIQRRLPVPPHILQLRAEVAKYIMTDEPGWKVQECMVKFANLRSQIRCEGFNKDPKAILAKSLEIDSELYDIFAETHPGWEYETFFTNDVDPRIFKGRYHRYFDIWVAQLWNGMRTIRIMLNEQIRNALFAGSSSHPQLFQGPESTAQIQLSSETMLQLASDIVDSVPQLTGYLDSKYTATPTVTAVGTPQQSRETPPHYMWMDLKNPSFSSSSSTAGSTPPVIHAAGGYFLMWPLLLLGRFSTLDSTRLLLTR
jgi:hypothetical protein